MVANTGGIVFVVIGKTPVGGEFVRRRLFGNGDFGRGHEWEEDGRCSRGRGSLEELTTGRLFALKEGEIERMSQLIHVEIFVELRVKYCR